MKDFIKIQIKKRKIESLNSQLKGLLHYSESVMNNHYKNQLYGCLKIKEEL